MNSPAPLASSASWLSAYFSPAFLRWGMIVLAILPFQLPLIRHLSFGPEATGFIQYDAAYYGANGREIFERGNGFAHPNPYDPDPAAPVIYFHWLTWLLGAGVKFLHLDPGALLIGVGLAASLVCSAATLALVETILPDRRRRYPLFLLTMWSGGVLCLVAAGFDLAHGREPFEDLFALDVGEGWWFQNWGRNLILPTEAVYHSLVAVAWVAGLRRRWTLALAAVAALAATHPFTGLQQLLIFWAWTGWLAWRERTIGALRRWLVVVVLLAAFAAYYLGFLNRFPAHRQLAAIWSTAWLMPLSAILLSIAPLTLVVLWRCRRGGAAWGDHERFLFLAFAVTFLLLKHDWFLPAHQPAHFSRGYHWLPVWLLALPQLQAWWIELPARVGRVAAAAILGAAALLAVSDNAWFLAREWTHGEGDRLHLTRDQREVLAWMDRADLRGVLLCADTRLSYLSATYASVRPYFGHINNTPDVKLRWQKVRAWLRRGEGGEWLQTIDYVLIARTELPTNFDWSNWRELHRNHDYLLLGRRGAAGEP